MGKGTFPRRQKCAEKKYTQSQVDKMLLDNIRDASRYNMLTTTVSFFLALHRAYGFGEKRLLCVLERMRQIQFDALTFDEIRCALKEETGIDIEKMTDE